MKNTMTKRELIDALMASEAPDDMEVIFESNDYYEPMYYPVLRVEMKTPNDKDGDFNYLTVVISDQ